MRITSYARALSSPSDPGLKARRTHHAAGHRRPETEWPLTASGPPTAAERIPSISTSSASRSAYAPPARRLRTWRYECPHIGQRQLLVVRSPHHALKKFPRPGTRWVFGNIRHPSLAGSLRSCCIRQATLDGQVSSPFRAPRWRTLRPFRRTRRTGQGGCPGDARLPVARRSGGKDNHRRVDSELLRPRQEPPVRRRRCLCPLD